MGGMVYTTLYAYTRLSIAFHPITINYHVIGFAVLIRSGVEFKPFTTAY